MFLTKKSLTIALFIVIPCVYGAQPEAVTKRKGSMLMVLSPTQPEAFGMLSAASAAAPAHESGAAVQQVFVPVKNGSSSALYSDAGQTAGSKNHTHSNRTHGSQHRSRVNESQTGAKHAIVPLNDQRVSTGEKAEKVHSNAQSYSGNPHMTPSHNPQQVKVLEASRNNKSTAEQHAELNRNENESPTEMIMMFDTPQNELALEKATSLVKKFLLDPTPIKGLAERLGKTPIDYLKAYWITAYIRNLLGKNGVATKEQEAEALAKWKLEFSTPNTYDNTQAVQQLAIVSATAAAPAQHAVLSVSIPAPSSKSDSACCCVIS
jgi:hypothetical protein